MSPAKCRGFCVFILQYSHIQYTELFFDNLWTLWCVFNFVAHCCKFVTDLVSTCPVLFFSYCCSFFYKCFNLCRDFVLVTVVKDTSDSYTKHFFDDAEYEEYLANIQSLSLYQTGVEVNKDSKIVSLSTCTNVSYDERLLVHGVKISEKMMGE